MTYSTQDIFLNLGKAQGISYLVLSFILLLGGCSEIEPTKEELEYIKIINAEYHQSYTFEGYDGTYLVAYCKDTVNEMILINIHKEILMRRPQIRWGYINVYDKSNIFLYQQYYNPPTNEFLKRNHEYH